jgi:hypothetical protein
MKHIKTIGVIALIITILWGGCLGCNKFNDWRSAKWKKDVMSEIDTAKFDIVSDKEYDDYILIAAKSFSMRRDTQYYITETIGIRLKSFFEQAKDQSGGGEERRHNIVFLDIKNKMSSWVEVYKAEDINDIVFEKLEWTSYSKLDKALEKYLVDKVKPYYMFHVFGEKRDVTSLISTGDYKIKEGYGNIVEKLINKHPHIPTPQQLELLAKGLDDLFSKQSTLQKPKSYNWNNISYYESVLYSKIADTYKYRTNTDTFVFTFTSLCYPLELDEPDEVIIYY